jgi:hypothetical protein
MAKIITCTIEDDGSISADAAGFHGKDCEAVLEQLLSALGTKVSAGHKPEYHQNVPATAQIKAGR